MDTPITNSIFRGAALSAVPLNKLGSLKEFLISWIGTGFQFGFLARCTQWQQAPSFLSAAQRSEGITSELLHLDPADD